MIKPDRFNNLLANVDRFKTKDELIVSLEDRKIA
jgi:hypothetical protein